MYTLWYASPQCYMQCFVEIGLLVPEKKIFESVLTYMGMAAILVTRPEHWFPLPIDTSYQIWL